MKLMDINLNLNKIYERLRKGKYSYICCYTLLFALCTALTVGYFILYHKTNIWQQDGLKQHYNALLYYGKYLRAVIKDLFDGGGFSLPMWDDTMGYGSDIVTTLHYYAIGDPLTLLSAVCPVSKMQYLYFGIYVLRLYLGGLAFSWLSLWHKNTRAATLLASLIYVFASYSLTQCLMHSCFPTPLVYFPLIILGIDKIFEDESPAVFIVFTSVAALSNFYYFYMQAALAALYIIYRYVCKYIAGDKVREGWHKSALRTLGRFALYGLNAFLISAVMLVPVLNVMLSSARWKAEKYVPPLYNISYYAGLIGSYVGHKGNGSGTLLGYTALPLVIVILLILRRKRHMKQFVIFAVMTLFLLIPAAGFALNGFAYVSNRWVWAYSLMTGCLFAALYPKLYELTAAERRRIAAVLSVLAVFSVALSPTRNERGFLSAALILLVAVLISLTELKEKNYGSTNIVVCAMLVFLIALNGYGQFSVTAGNSFIEEFTDSGIADRKLTRNNADALLEGAAEGDFYRVNEEGIDSTQNSSIQRRINTTGFYFSLTNPYISDFINYMYFIWPKDYDYEGCDNRSVLDALASVKYYLVKEGEEYKLPFNYTEEVGEGEFYGGRAKLYKGKGILPFGTAYDFYVPLSDFEKMDVATRQNALLDGAVLEDSSFERAEVTSDAVSVLKNISGTGSVEIDEEAKTILVRRNATVTFNIDGLDEAETYLIMKGLSYGGIPQRATYDEGGWAGLTVFERYKVKAGDRYFSPDVTTSLRVAAGDKADIVEYYTPKHIYYCGRHDFLTNMGYNKKGLKEINMTFRDPGLYSFEDLDVVCQSVGSIEKKLQKLSVGGMERVTRGINSYSGGVSLSDPKIMVFSVPFSKGWRVFVNGEEKELKRANIMYMGVELDAGESDIELRYETPGLRLGAMLTLAGIVMLAAILAIRNMEKRKNGGDRP